MNITCTVKLLHITYLKPGRKDNHIFQAWAINKISTSSKLYRWWIDEQQFF